MALDNEILDAVLKVARSKYPTDLRKGKLRALTGFFHAYDAEKFSQVGKGLTGVAHRARVPCVRFPLWMGQSTKPIDVVASFEAKALANS